MTENKFDVDQSHQKLMELLVSRTLRKHGIKKGKATLSNDEKDKLKNTIQYLQMQSQKLLNPAGNAASIANTQADIHEPEAVIAERTEDNILQTESSTTKTSRPNKLNLARRRRKK
ncbi:hypothetical protein [Peribacillus sp. SCS-155]|uniref:hypothetical protein n=1 Tax=Peribacillus sedimenti TaxID=3115297 RepID=UPI003906C336